jgi:YidC/Oxa1 family membrane protein insertase
MGSIVPLLIQMPILIGLYWVISGITDSSNFYHLYSIFANFDPRTIYTEFYGLNLGQIGGITGILLGLVLGILQYIQARLSFAYQGPTLTPEKKEVKEGEAPEIALDPEMMKKMMLYFFPVMIAITSYFFPLGVGLYWFIGTIFVIVQQWYVNQIKVK